MADAERLRIGEENYIGGVLGPILYDPYPRTGFVHPSEPSMDAINARNQARKHLIGMVYTGPEVKHPYDMSSDELEELVTPDSLLARQATMYDEVQMAVWTLDADAVDEQQLLRIHNKPAIVQAIVEDGVPRDWNGTPILAGTVFGITAEEARATALKFGIQDGTPRTLEEVAKETGDTRREAGKKVLETVRKFRDKQRGVIFSTSESTNPTS